MVRTRSEGVDSMIKKIIAPVLLLTLMTVMIVQAIGTDEVKDEKASPSTIGLGVGLKAPDFELENLAGDKVKLSDFVGKKVMLNFWATWCPPCKAEIPDMQKLSLEEQGNIVILAVNIDPENDVAGFAKQMGVTFPILLDKTNKVNKTYQIISIPTSYFIDEKGLIKYKHIGAMDIKAMKKYIDM